MTLKIVHADPFPSQLLNGLHSIFRYQPVLFPDIVGLGDVDKGIVIQRPTGVEVMVIAGNNVQFTCSQGLHRPLALAFHGAQIHLQSVLFQEAARLHHLPQRHVPSRAIEYSNLFPSHLATLSRRLNVPLTASRLCFVSPSSR